jgi:hypothetical protein
MKKTKSKNSSQVLNKKKILNKLLNDKKNIELEMKQSVENMNDIASNKISENLLNRLPIESFEELYVRKQSPMEILKDHSNERKKQLECIKKISNIDHQIYQAKIDLVIEKINNVLEKLN